MRGRARVDDDGGGRVPRLLLATYEELAASCRRAPVDAPHVVARVVLTDQHVVGADHTRLLGERVARGAAATDRTNHRQWHDPRSDLHLAGGAETPVELDELERVRRPYGQRSRMEPAAPEYCHGVRERAATPEG